MVPSAQIDRKRAGRPEGLVALAIGKTRQFGPVVGMTLASQIVSAVSLLILPSIGSIDADVYSIGIQTGYAALGGVVIGVVYNVAIGRPHFIHWRLSGLISFVFSIVAGVVTWLVLISTNHELQHGGLFASAVIVGSFAVGGGALGVSGTLAVRLACAGRPFPMAAVTVSAALSLIVFLPLSVALHLPHFLPAILWMVVCFAQIPFFVRLRPPALIATSQAEAESSRRQLIHALALCLGVITSSILPSFFLASLTQLPAGTTSLTFLVSRIGTSLVGLGVNSILLVRYNWRDKVAETGRLPTCLVLISVGFGLAHLILKSANDDGLSYVLLVIAWMSMLIASAIIIRAANARRLIGAVSIKVVIDVTLAACAAFYLLKHPSVPGFFGAYMISQAVTTMICGFGLKLKLLAVASALALCISVVIVVWGQ